LSPATFETTSYTPEQLLLGGEVLSRSVVLAAGAGTLVRGSVLGLINLGPATSAAKSGGNTGNGTLTLDAAAPLQRNVQTGIYAVRCIAAAANAGTFRITAPDGAVLGDIAAGAQFSNQIRFAIADGATDFVVGDGFDITVGAGSGKYLLSLPTALDGSAVPDAVLAEDADATAADVVVPAYFRADLNANAVTLGAGHTVASIREGLRAKGLNLIAVQTTY
jgi:hypothetical protein